MKRGTAEENAAVAAANQQLAQKEHAKMQVDRGQHAVAAAAAAAATRRKPGRLCKELVMARGVQHGASLPTAPSKRKDREAKKQHRFSKRHVEKHNLEAVALHRGYL